MNPNAASRKDIRSLEKQAKEEARQDAEVIIHIMSSTSGRGYIWRILTKCHCFATTFVPGQPDVGNINEGRRQVGLEILDSITAACPDHFITAMREANVRNTVSERRVSPGLSGDDSGSSGERDGRPEDGDADGIWNNEWGPESSGQVVYDRN